MSKLFESTTINSMPLKNRLVRSATFERMCNEDGYPLPKLRTMYEKLAQGGVGLIITGFATVSADMSTPFTSRMDDDIFIPEFKKITDRIHDDGCRMAMQINHPGRQMAESELGKKPIAPSAVRCKFPASMPRAMTEQDIWQVIGDYADAAVRVKKAGFDAVQLHGSAGYLINQFLSPYTNRRKDSWGGSLENRTRFLKEIYLACRRALGENYPILIKLNAYDGMKRGLKLPEGVRMAEMAAEMGFDAIEVACGIFEDGLSTLRGKFPVDILIDDFHFFDQKPVARFLLRHFGEKIFKTNDFTMGYNREAARLIKSKISIPVIMTGGMHDPKMMMEVIEKGEADYVSLSRPLIADPSFPAKIENNHLTPSKCIHCNYCFFYLMKAPLKCYYGKRAPGAI